MVSGGARPKVVELPMNVKRSHLVRWKRETINIDQKKLATQRDGRSRNWRSILKSVSRPLKFTSTGLIVVVEKRSHDGDRQINFNFSYAGGFNSFYGATSEGIKEGEDRSITAYQGFSSV